MSIDAILSTRIKEAKVEEISAKDCFENLGFVKVETESAVIFEKKHKYHLNRVIFDKELKTFTTLQIWEDKTLPYPVKMSVMSAIQRELAELGWHVI